MIHQFSNKSSLYIRWAFFFYLFIYLASLLADGTCTAGEVLTTTRNSGLTVKALFPGPYELIYLSLVSRSFKNLKP